LHANGAGKMYVDEQNKPLIEKNAIYARIQSFHNRNRFYLYIQSNRQRSYNFYGNYAYSEANTNDLKIGTSSDTLIETTFATQGWPIHVFQQSQMGSQDVHQVTLQLTTDSYRDAGLFVQTGVLASAQEENFVRQENLLQEATEDGSIDTNYTQPIVFATPAMGEHTIASFAQIIYEGKLFFVQEYAPPPEPDQPSLTPETHILKDIDDVFGLFNVRSSVVPAHDQQLPTIVDEKLQLINFPNGVDSTDMGAIKYKKVEDQLLKDDGSYLSRVTFETLLYSIKKEVATFTRSSSGHSDSVSTHTQSYTNESNSFYKPQKPYLLGTKVFTSSLTPINGLILETTFNHLPTKKILGITASEFQALQELATTHNLTYARVFFKSLFSEEGYITSIEEVAYKTSILGIVTENSSGTLQVFFPDNEILVYTIDLFVFFSQSYSEFIPDAIQALYPQYQTPELP